MLPIIVERAHASHDDGGSSGHYEVEEAAFRRVLVDSGYNFYEGEPAAELTPPVPPSVFMTINLDDSRDVDDYHDGERATNVEVLMRDDEDLYEDDEGDDEDGDDDCSYNLLRTDDVVSRYCDTTVVVYDADIRQQEMEDVVNNDDYTHYIVHGNNSAGQQQQQHQQRYRAQPKADHSDRFCELCEILFDSADDFLDHVSVKHPVELSPKNPKRFNCPFCDYSSKSKMSVKQHVRRHTKEKPFECRECGKTFSQKAGVQQHMRSHSANKPHRCTEPNCGLTFKCLNALKTHVSMKHKGERPFKCNICLLTFPYSTSLRAHKRTHSDERPYQCRYCDRSFRQQGHLKTHTRLHTGDKPFVCQVCKRSFTHVGNLKQHTITRHTRNFPYVCNICDKGFLAPSDHKRHMVREHAAAANGEAAPSCYVVATS